MLDVPAADGLGDITAEGQIEFGTEFSKILRERLVPYPVPIVLDAVRATGS
jgi:hypothetical protein